MKGLLDLIKQRQSVRKYSNQPVEKDKILQCLEAARLAPSARNAQPWKFIVVDNAEVKNKIAKAATSPFLPVLNKHLFEAPVIVAVVIEPPKIATPAQIIAWLDNRELPLIDIGIATEHFCLQATELGLGNCIVGWFDEQKVKNILAVPKRQQIGLLITLGYPKEGHEVHKKNRKDISEISNFNIY